MMQVAGSNEEKPSMCPTESGRSFSVAMVIGALVLGSFFCWSAWEPVGRFTWWLESIPVLLGVPLAVWLHRRAPLSPVSLTVIWVSAMMMLLGAHYTFAEVPLGEWIQNVFSMDRNPYDRMGHVFQGILPAIVVRELLVRNTALRPGALLFVLVCCVALSVSAMYELIECWAALGIGGATHSFLGTQGDIWDTQWDMTCALSGAMVSQWLLSRWQDRWISAVATTSATAIQSSDPSELREEEDAECTDVHGRMGLVRRWMWIG